MKTHIPVCTRSADGRGINPSHRSRAHREKYKCLLSESITQWSQARRKLQAGVVKLEQWRENELYRNGLLDQKRTLVEQLSVVQEQLEQKRAVLLEHELELKQVEKLIEHAESALDAHRLAAEQASLDEWSGVQASISRTTRP